MKALFIRNFAREKVIAKVILFSLAVWIYPQHPASAAGAQSIEQNTALVFEIKNQNSDDTSLQYHEILENDPLVKNLQEYLEKHKSPLAQYAKEIVQQPQWQRALAVSWVESNFGRFCADNNCSGIGVEPGHPSWRKYKTKLDWFKDMCQLLETPRYKDKYTTFEKMRGIYVYPGTNNWVNGAKKKYAELTALEKQSEEEKQFALQSNKITLLAEK